jgi:hypothetical protein
MFYDFPEILKLLKLEKRTEELWLKPLSCFFDCLRSSGTVKGLRNSKNFKTFEKLFNPQDCANSKKTPRPKEVPSPLRLELRKPIGACNA